MSVKSSVDKHGVALTYRHKTSGGTYNPALGSLSGATTTDYNISGYIFDYDLTEVDGTSITRGDRKVLIYTTDLSGVALPEPEVGDNLIGSGDTVSVVSTRKIYSNGGVKCYILQVRE